MRETINQTEVLQRLKNINIEIDNIIQLATEHPEMITDRAEKELDLLLANKTAYSKMVLKLIKQREDIALFMVSNTKYNKRFTY